ncbi:MAG: ribonuclease [Rhizobiales bacterium 12-68-15]|nr:MAG: ribonuclease [Rhizobiales bacterium 12-68-15]
MANKMLIDATHPEETRVVVVRGSRVEEFDYEAASRKQLRGNIYLAKVTRVEPSLQAAFVEYGGNRHGFLAFSEIHPDYYQIPVADRLALLEEEERAARQADEEDERRERRRSRPRRARRDEAVSGQAEDDEDGESGGNVEEVDADDSIETIEDGQISGGDDEDDDHDAPARETHARSSHGDEDDAPHIAEEMFGAASADVTADALPAPQQQADTHEAEVAAEAPEGETDPAPQLVEAAQDDQGQDDQGQDDQGQDDRHDHSQHDHGHSHDHHDHDAHDHHGSAGDEDEDGADEHHEEEVVEQLGSTDALEELPARTSHRRARSYKIQEVIRRRQVMLVQVVKEERGNKGAALTTYLSLAGRYSVLMPNTARGGGISRKITNAVDRKRLKEVVQDLEVPEGMGIILRTAGANRTKVEIKRDFEYLLRLWETVRELTLGSAAPSLVYEEGSLIKRAIRDLFNKDIDDIHVAGEEGFKEARDFMRMLMPSHVKNVIPYRETQPIFAKYGVEQQLDAMFSPVVQLKSGGYIVINPTEALVSIDVNSGRATREHHIEDTALKTNVEAAEEIARQLRLRDLAGLIVIDFIDMEENRNNRAVERKLKDCLKNDRARIQVGRISHFGLMEMSRQRIRTGVLESSIEVCPTCGGTGHVRSASSVALQLLRALEEQLVRAATHNLVGRTRSEVALYVLNHKRAHLRELEERFSVTLVIVADDRVTGHQPFIIEKGEPAMPAPAAPRPGRVVQPDSILPEEEYEEEDEDGAEETPAEAESEDGEERTERTEDGNGRRKRRRRRRRGGEREGGERDGAEGEGREARPEAEGAEGDDDTATDEAEGEAEDGDEDERGDGKAGDDRRRRRRGRRGGRRNRRDEDEGAPRAEGEGSEGDDARADSAEGGDARNGDAEAPETGVQAPVLSADTAGETAPEAEAPAVESPVASEPRTVEARTVEAPEAPVSEKKVAVAKAAEAPVEAPAAEPAPAKPSRRRSTVREKAPGAAAPAAPVVTDAPAVEAPIAPEAPVAVTEAPVETAGANAASPASASGEETASVPVSDADMPLVTDAAPAEAEPAADAAPAPVAPAEAAPAEPAPAAPAAPPAKARTGWWQRKLFGE